LIKLYIHIYSNIHICLTFSVLLLRWHSCDTTAKSSKKPSAASRARSAAAAAEYAGACERAGDITRVNATWNATRRDEGPTQGTHTGDPHRGEGPTEKREPTTGGEGHTGDPHRTRTDTESQYEQSLVCLSNRDCVDVSRCCTFYCNMANNCLITVFFLIVLA